MKILIIGGTRLLGKKITELLINNPDNKIFIISRKANIFKDSCISIQLDKKLGLKKVAGIAFDLVIDFISYDRNDIEDVFKNIIFKKYIFISTCWINKLNHDLSLDNFIDIIDSDSIQLLPEITKNYLINKCDSELYLRESLLPEDYTIIRLPILWGENDHTERLLFYISRFLDQSPVILVNNGLNDCQIGYVDDIAKNIVEYIYKINLSKLSIIEALPTNAKSTRDILSIIQKSLNTHSTFLNLSSRFLSKNLPQYLNEEPLWRESVLGKTNSNLFYLNKTNSISIESWLSNLCINQIESVRPKRISALRKQELQLITMI